MARDTKAEILAVAAELFTSKGYEATSLREIAERLGITKAALYYHFPSKEDILIALIEPAFAIGFELIERLAAARNVDEWAEALEWTLGVLFDHRQFFRLAQMNRHSIDQLMNAHEEMHDRLDLRELVEKTAHAIATDLPQEIRMIAALGALSAFDEWAPELLAETDADVLRQELTAVIHDILKP